MTGDCQRRDLREPGAATPPATRLSDKELAAGNYKHGYGFHPLRYWLDEASEALAAILRPGNAGPNKRQPPRFSVGYEPSDSIRTAALDVPEATWIQAIDADGKQRKGA